MSKHEKDDTDAAGNKLATYTLLMPCTPVGEMGPQCPAGWESVGYTQPGSCSIGNVPGDGPFDTWKEYGYQRVCKRRVPTSGDQAVDCCSNLFGIANSVECKARGWKPYSWECNNVMKDKCNTNVSRDIYAHEWDGMPYGQGGAVYRPCSGKVLVAGESQPGCIDEFCVNYLRNAPPNNYFHNHDFSDYPYDFPRHSYTMPQFADTFGYQPMRTPYRPFHEYEWKNSNSYCRQFPQECWNTYINDYHF